MLTLTQGTRTLDLESTRFMHSGFVPPARNSSYSMATGTSANRRGGSSVASRKDHNRTFAFQVRVMGNNALDTDLGMRQVASMLSSFGDKNFPLTINVKGDSLPEPLWGQLHGATRWEVVSARAAVGSLYGNSRYTRDKVNIMDIEVEVKPHPTGARQRVATAKGGILEDALARAASIGLRIQEARTNLVNNPIFGNSTYLTNWTAQSALTTTKITDPCYVLFGTASVLINSNAGANNIFFISITTANTNTHAFSCYARLRDGSAVSGTHLVLRYNNVNLTTTYTAIGGGWYRLTATAAGSGGAQNFGVVVSSGASVYLDGFQAEEGAYVTDLIYGDLLGCSWASTVHASTSSRAAGYVRLPVGSDTILAGSGTVIIPWKPPLSNSGYTSNVNLLNGSGSSNFYLRFNSTSDALDFVIGSTTTSSSALTFAADSLHVIHVVWEQGRVELYWDGASVGSGSTFVPPTLGTYLYIGTDTVGASHAGGTFMGFATTGQAYTDAQVTESYGLIDAVIDREARADWIPWLWTKDGDDVVDNCNDSTRDNWFCANGIPGDVEAWTEMEVSCSEDLDPTYTGAFFLSNLDLDYFFNPGNLYFDMSGTVDANASGGAVQTISLAPGSNAFSGGTDITSAQFRALAGRQVYCWTRIKDAGSTLKIGLEIDLGGLADVTSPLQAIPSANWFLTRLTKPAAFPNIEAIGDEYTFNASSRFFLVVNRTTGTTNLTCDFFQYVVAPLTKIGIASSPTGYKRIYYNSRRNSMATYATANTNIGTSKTYRLGDDFEFKPNKYNMVSTIIGDPTVNTAEIAVTQTLTFNKVYVTPRWEVL